MLKHKYKILVKGSNSHIPRPIGQKRWGHDVSSCCKNFQVLGNFKWMPRWKRIIGTEGRESQGKQVAVILGRTIAAKLPRNVHHVPPIEPMIHAVVLFVCDESPTTVTATRPHISRKFATSCVKFQLNLNKELGENCTVCWVEKSWYNSQHTHT